MTDASTESVQSQRTYRQLRQAILRGDYPPGTRLRVVEIAGREAVSPGAVREALATLASEHLVVTLPQRGFRVAPIMHDEMYDLFTTRALLESRLAQQAAEIGDPVWHTDLTQAWHKMTAQGRGLAIGDGLAEAHEAFHRTLIAGCNSVWSLRMFDMLYGASERYRFFAYRYLVIGRDPHAEHAKMLEAALAGEGQRLAELCRLHILATRDRLSHALNEAGESELGA